MKRQEAINDFSQTANGRLVFPLFFSQLRTGYRKMEMSNPSPTGVTFVAADRR
jgi:hypothetical protein